MLDLTICSVCYFSEKYNNLNLELTDLSGVSHEWIVANNTTDALPRLNDSVLDPSFKIIKGFTDREAKLPKGCKAIGQLQHGASINLCLNEVRPSKFLLVIDPDFFTYVPIRYILDHMYKNELGLFGSPYLSKTPTIPNYPTGFNLYIDLEKIPLKTLDFLPGGKGHENYGFYCDMGWKIYNKHKYELKTPYEITLPYVPPKERNDRVLFSANSLKSKYGITYDNTPNEKGTKMDEYFWKDEYYASHLRMKLNQSRNYLKERVDYQLETIKRIFAELKCKA